jgi:glycosyltransferase involved in cell wall biosynthesis
MQQNDEITIADTTLNPQTFIPPDNRTTTLQPDIVQNNLFLPDCEKKASTLHSSSIDIVHPCFNPHLNWEKELLSHYQKLRAKIDNNVLINIYVVDDGSSKGFETSQIEFLHQQIPHFNYITYKKNQGKGYAVRMALSQTTSQIIIYTDIDYPYMMENLIDMYKLLSIDKYDIVVGVRNKNYYKKLSLVRKIVSLSLKLTNSILYPKLFVKDTQSGLKGFNLKGKEIMLKTKINSFLFDMEFLVLASRKKDLKISQMTVEARDGIKFSTLKWKTVKAEVVNFAHIFGNTR